MKTITAKEYADRVGLDRSGILKKLREGKKLEGVKKYRKTEDGIWLLELA
jgi:hypothetical protein